MTDPYSPQPYEPDDEFDPDARYAPKPYMPPPGRAEPYGPPPAYGQLPPTPMSPYAGQHPPPPYMGPVPHQMYYPVRPPRKYNSIALHILLFFLTGGIGNVIYALWIYDHNRRNGY